MEYHEQKARKGNKLKVLKDNGKVKAAWICFVYVHFYLFIIFCKFVFQKLFPFFCKSLYNLCKYINVRINLLFTIHEIFCCWCCHLKSSLYPQVLSFLAVSDIFTVFCILLNENYGCVYVQHTILIVCSNFNQTWYTSYDLGTPWRCHPSVVVERGGL